MKIYVASFFNTRERLFPVLTQLEALGHCVISTWFYESRADKGPDAQTEPHEYTSEELAGFALRDYREINIADLLIVDTFDVTHRGGREWEGGYAAGLGIDVWVVGPRRNVFHWIVQRQFDNWEECLYALRKAD